MTIEIKTEYGQKFNIHVKENDILELKYTEVEGKKTYTIKTRSLYEPYFYKYHISRETYYKLKEKLVSKETNKEGNEDE